MDPNIVGSSIVALATLFGGMISVFAKGMIENKNFAVIDKRKRRALNKKWLGSLVYSDSDIHLGKGQPIEIIFSTFGKKVSGRLSYSYPDSGEIVNLKIKGGFCSDEYLKFDYLNSDISMHQFGHIILKLSPDGKNMNGLLQGYGRHSQRLISSKINIRATD